MTHLIQTALALVCIVVFAPVAFFIGYGMYSVWREK